MRLLQVRPLQLPPPNALFAMSRRHLSNTIREPVIQVFLTGVLHISSYHVV